MTVLRHVDEGACPRMRTLTFKLEGRKRKERSEPVLDTFQREMAFCSSEATLRARVGPVPRRLPRILRAVP